MGAQSTVRISRDAAISTIAHEVALASNSLLGDILDLIANSGQAKVVSSLDNFDVGHTFD